MISFFVAHLTSNEGGSDRKKASTFEKPFVSFIEKQGPYQQKLLFILCFIQKRLGELTFQSNFDLIIS